MARTIGRRDGEGVTPLGRHRRSGDVGGAVECRRDNDVRIGIHRADEERQRSIRGHVRDRRAAGGDVDRRRGAVDEHRTRDRRGVAERVDRLDGDELLSVVRHRDRRAPCAVPIDGGRRGRGPDRNLDRGDVRFGDAAAHLQRRHVDARVRRRRGNRHLGRARVQEHRGRGCTLVSRRIDGHGVEIILPFQQRDAGDGESLRSGVHFGGATVDGDGLRVIGEAGHRHVERGDRAVRLRIGDGDVRRRRVDRERALGRRRSVDRIRGDHAEGVRAFGTDRRRCVDDRAVRLRLRRTEMEWSAVERRRDRSRGNVGDDDFGVNRRVEQPTAEGQAGGGVDDGHKRPGLVEKEVERSDRGDVAAVVHGRGADDVIRLLLGDRGVGRIGPAVQGDHDDRMRGERVGGGDDREHVAVELRAVLERFPRLRHGDRRPDGVDDEVEGTDGCREARRVGDHDLDVVRAVAGNRVALHVRIAVDGDDGSGRCCVVHDDGEADRRVVGLVALEGHAVREKRNLGRVFGQREVARLGGGVSRLVFRRHQEDVQAFPDHDRPRRNGRVVESGADGVQRQIGRRPGERDVFPE